MGFIKNEGRDVFDTTRIQRGYFIFGKHQSWPEGRNGLAAGVDEGELLVQFLPGIRNVTSHYRIRAVDVVKGKWTLRVSPDLVSIEEVNIEEVNIEEVNIEEVNIEEVNIDGIA